MADGNKKMLSDIKPGDRVITLNRETHRPAVVNVKGLTVHEAKNYAITKLTLVSVQEKVSNAGNEVLLLSRQLEATTNHPVMIRSDIKNMGTVSEGAEVL